MSLNIQENTIFVADSHYNLKNTEFLAFLQEIDSKRIKTNQLILMGDNFDFLSAECKYFIKQNERVIKLLNKLSNSIEMVYLEGNHDYNLQKIFPNIKVIKRENQPLFAKYKDKTIALSHGDNFINWQYNLYCSIIRNQSLLKILNMIDYKSFISKKIESTLLEKNICHKMQDFESLVTKRINNYKTDIVIEGHYHQGSVFVIENKKYVNIPSLCCDNKYMRLNNYKFIGENI